MHELEIWIFWITALLLGYIFAGYPVLLSVFSKIIRRQPVRAFVQPTVTLTIPAYNEADVLAAKLENAQKLEYPCDKLEILVGDDCSNDATANIARSFADQGVQLLSFDKRRGKASVMNDLLAAARGEVILLCDANVMFDANALEKLLVRLEDNSVGAVCGDVRLQSEQCNFGTGESLYYTYERKMQLWESQVGSLMGVDGGMYLLRKALFQPLPPDTILDDFTVSMRVIRQGKRVVFEPDAIATEGATPSARTEFRRRVRISMGAVQSLLRFAWPPFSRPVELWQFVSHKLLRWMMPLWLLVLFVANVSLWGQGAFYQATLTGQAAIYLLALLGVVSLRIRGTRVGGAAFYLLMTYAAMLWGSLKGMVSRPTGVWRKTERMAS